MTLIKEKEAPTLRWASASGGRLDFYRGKEFEVNLPSLKERAAVVNDEVFRLNPLWTAEEIHFHMPDPTELIERRKLRKPKDMRDNSLQRSIAFATTTDERDIAMIIQNLLPVEMPGSRKELLLWTGLRAVEKGSQRHGIGTELLRRSVEAYLWLAPGYVLGRTQHPGIYLSLERSDLFDIIYPIHEDFDEESLYIVKQVAPQTMHPVEINDNGLAIGQYKEGKTGGYDKIDLSNSDIQRIESILQNKVGLNRKRGDASYYAGRLRSVHNARKKTA